MIKMCRSNGQFTYYLTSSIAVSEDFGTAIVYGISIREKNKISAVEDISDDFEFVRSLFDLIVEEKLYPEHLMDVTEDFLSENSNALSFSNSAAAVNFRKQHCSC